MPADPNRKTFLASVARALSRLNLPEPLVLIVVIVIAGGIWGFIELAEEMLEGDTKAFDRNLIVALRNPDDLSDPLGPKWLEELGRDVSALGGVGILSLLTLASAGFLILDDKRHAALFC